MRACLSRPILSPKCEKPEVRVPSRLVSLNFKSVTPGAGASRRDGVLSFQGKDYPFAISGLSLVNVGVSPVLPLVLTLVSLEELVTKAVGFLF